GNARTVLYRVLEVSFISAENDPVDAAVLKIEALPTTTNSPKPLTVSTADTFDIERLYVVGHPGRMPAIPQQVLAGCGRPDERERVRFGELMAGAATIAGEVVHDASTIGGYSGGCVLGFSAAEVRALHFYGDSVAGNRAITADALRRHAIKVWL